MAYKYLTKENLKALRKKPHKYLAKATRVDDILFHSKAEAARYVQLKTLEMEGKISGLKLQPKYTFACGVKYCADFSYICLDTWEEIVEDVKGRETAEFKIKRKMMEHEFNVDIKLVKMDYVEADTWIKIGLPAGPRRGE